MTGSVVVRTAPGTALRALLGGLGVALLGSVVAAAPAGRATWPSVLLGAALLAWVVAAPGSPAPTVLLLLAAVVVLDAGVPAWPLLVLQAACLSGVHLLASLCAVAPAAARWEVTALTPVLRRWALAQAAGLPVVVAVAATPPGGLGPGLAVAAGVVAALVVGGLVGLARHPPNGHT